jgi:RNA polymerase sigma-70 factor (ECF subfamily)
MSAVTAIRAAAHAHGSAGWRTPDRVSCSRLAAVTTAVPSPGLGPAELYPQLRLFVRRVLARLGTPAADVDDLAHEVFFTLHRKGCTFTHERAARAWLYATARRVAANDRRARSRAALREPDWSPTEPPAPDVAIERAEAAASVEHFAARLPQPARSVFALSEVEGLTAPEIADTLGLPLNTTYSHIRRVRQRFARSLLVGVTLLLLLVALLLAGCSTGAGDDGHRVAIRGAADPARAAAARR